MCVPQLPLHSSLFRKMGLLSYIVLTFLSLLLDTGCCSAGMTNVLYVTPAVNTSCPEKPCLTISQYAQNSEEIFKSNSRLIFLQGDHTLNENFTLQVEENFTMLTLEGHLHQSKIHFGELVKFYISGLHKFKIESLLFLENSNLFVGGCKTIFVSSVVLGVLSAGIFHTLSHGGNQVVLSYMSVGSSLALLLTIIMFHVTKQFTGTYIHNIILQKTQRRPDLTPITNDSPEENKELLLASTTSYIPPLPYNCTP